MRHMAVAFVSDAQICKDFTHKEVEALTGLIKAYGYRYSVSAGVLLAFCRGFHIY